MPPFLSFLYQRVRVQNAKAIGTTVEMSSGILKEKNKTEIGRWGSDSIPRWFWGRAKKLVVTHSRGHKIGSQFGLRAGSHSNCSMRGEAARDIAHGFIFQDCWSAWDSLPADRESHLTSLTSALIRTKIKAIKQKETMHRKENGGKARQHNTN